MSGVEIVGLIAAIGQIATLGVTTTQKLHEVTRNISKYADDATRLRT